MLKGIRDAVLIRRQAIVNEHLALTRAIDFEEFKARGKDIYTREQHEAKVAAERNNTVGESTAFEILTHDGSLDLSDKGFAYLKRKVRQKKLPVLTFSEMFLEVFPTDRPSGVSLGRHKVRDSAYVPTDES